MNAGEDSKLKIEITTEPAIVMSRTFDAPRQLVFEAHGNPQDVQRWWRPRDFEMPVCEMDFRTGGTFRFVHRARDGAEYPMQGEYREVVIPEKITLGLKIGTIACLETLAFTEEDGKTTITSTMVFDSIEDRDAIPAADMATGTAEAFDLLEELLAERS